MPEVAPRRVFRFGLFEADRDTGELRKGGKRIRLQEQPFQVLMMLLDHPGELVTREEIRQRLWPADTFVDFDHGLNTAVNKLRDALGDSAANPRFIETLARRGYRFIAPVETMAGAAPPSAVERADPDFPAVATGADPVMAKGVGDSPSNSRFWGASGQILTRADEVPSPPRGLVRFLFLLIQIMYLIFYLASLAKLGRVHDLIDEMVSHTTWAVVLLVITAAVGIPTRLYLISAVSFDYKGLGAKFQKLFAFLFPLDELWALAPFLLMRQIGLGLALAATAALLYLPFAQRSLMLMGYRDPEAR